MRASFLSQERADIAETVKRLAQGMSSPHLGHWELLKWLARFLIYKPDKSFVFRPQSMPDALQIYVDSDFAGSRTPKVYDWNGSDFWYDQGFEQFAECGGTERLRVGVLRSGPWCFTRALVAGLLPQHRHQGGIGDSFRFNLCKELCEQTWA